jgi:serine phosphatase RsbU (regulator of sigma subunit)
VELPSGWSLLLYSDGLIEGRVGEGPQRLGEEALHRMLEEYLREHADWRERAEDMLDWLIARAEALNAGALSDDVALMLLGSRGS